MEKLKKTNLWIFFLVLYGLSIFSFSKISAQSADKAFKWPDGKQVALSLSFDDARQSQVDTGTKLFDKYGVKATFYVVPDAMEARLDGWKEAVKNGHEIGNHSFHHPCTGNFGWSRDHALEDYTLENMQDELTKTNNKINEMLGVLPVSFAYPCGQKFVGRGSEAKSYIPVVSGLFSSGRGWLDETANAPSYLDQAQLLGVEMDGKDFNEIKLLIESAKKDEAWLILAGHEIATKGTQTTKISMLKKLIKYAQLPDSKIWLAPVGTISEYVSNFNPILE